MWACCGYLLRFGVAWDELDRGTLCSVGPKLTTSTAPSTFQPGKDRPLDALNSADHINEYIEGTISRLGSAPDLYYLHRIEPGRDLKESIGALNGLKQKGKCKYIGLSECNADTLRKACASGYCAVCRHHGHDISNDPPIDRIPTVAQIDALQIEYSPWFTDHESNNLIATARELGVAIIAYSPLGKGVLTGTFTSPDQFAPNDLRKNTPRFQGENWDHNMKLVDEFKKLAEKRGCTPGQLALSWVMAQGAIPIPGTRKVERLEENFGATGIELSEEELKGVRKLIEEAKVTGARWV